MFRGPQSLLVAAGRCCWSVEKLLYGIGLGAAAAGALHPGLRPLLRGPLRGALAAAGGLASTS